MFVTKVHNKVKVKYILCDSLKKEFLVSMVQKKFQKISSKNFILVKSFLARTHVRFSNTKEQSKLPSYGRTNQYSFSLNYTFLFLELTDPTLDSLRFRTRY